MSIQFTTPATVRPKGYQQLTLSGIATLTVPAGAKLAWLQAEVQDARFTDDDDTTVSASLGMILKAGANPIPYVGDLSKLSFIQVVAGSIVNVTYFAYSGQ